MINNFLYKQILYFWFLITPLYLFNSQYVAFSIIILLFSLVLKKDKNLLKIRFSEIMKFKPILVLFMFIAYTYLSLLWTSNMEHGLWAQKIYREALIFIPVLLFSLDMEDAKKGLKLFTYGFAIYAIYSLGIYFEFYTIKESIPSDPRGHLSYAIVTPMLAMGILFSYIHSYYSNNKLEKITFILIFILCLFAFLINNGRSAHLSIILTVFTFLLFFFRSFFTKKIILIMFLGFTISIYSLVNFSSKFTTGYKELKSVFLENKYEGSWGIRSYLYRTSVLILKDNPLFGVGAGDTRVEYRKIAEKENTYASFGSLHNQHFEILLRYGLLGYILLISSVCMLIYQLKINKQYQYLAFSLYCTIFYNGLFNSLMDKKPINILFLMSFVFFTLIIIESKKKLIQKD